MEKRREFLKKVPLTALAATIGGTAAYSNNVKADFLSRTGIITNTVKAEMDENYKQTLEKLAEIGYKYIEGSVKGDSIEEYKKVLNANGLKSIGSGSSMSNLQEGLDEAFKTAEALDHEYVICYWPWLSSAQNLTKAEVMSAADNINSIGKKVKEAGFRFAWHNHDKEFQEINDDNLPFDLLLKNTDPDLSTVEMDWYWVVKGGQDPADYFKKYPGRFEIAHVKDMNNNRDGGITCVGNGVMDFDAILKDAPTGGVRYYIVENERAVKGMKCARESYQHLAGLNI